jgi:hypothetical protein
MKKRMILVLAMADGVPARIGFPWENVSATSGQGTCALLEDSNVVRCDLGTIPSEESASINVTVTPTMLGKITNYAAHTGENQASATVVVE